MMAIKSKKRVALGRQVEITAAASIAVPSDEVYQALSRHANGDWGEIGEKDWMRNDLAHAEGGGRLLSRYRSKRGIWFWIITESDRSATTVLLEEY